MEQINETRMNHGFLNIESNTYGFSDFSNQGRYGEGEDLNNIILFLQDNRANKLKL